MGKQTQKKKNKKKTKQDQLYDDKASTKCRKNHKIGYKVRLKIIDRLLVDQDEIKIKGVVSRFKTKNSTIKCIKKRALKNDYITIFDKQQAIWNHQLEVMNTIFEKQMLLAQQNMHYVQALHKIFYQTDIPNFYQVQTLDQYNQQQKKVIQKYLNLYQICTPKKQKEAKEEDSQFKDKCESSKLI